ncbi:MAG TPA: pyrroloquinoline quinone biosynthesis protein PqqB [Xanthobacteraceae bacterium]|nr:pyrroloquinoline quinone biosynthesis protein PqqB [Xanthobacteraceae bacterium]
MTVRVLGSAAGGGFPQWNCRCAVCALAWENDARVAWRTQTGLAVSGDGRTWILLNASPDLRIQLAAARPLRPNGAPRGSPVAAVVLTGAEIDQAAGLLHLREGHAFSLFGSPDTLATLAENPMFRALAQDKVVRCAVAPGKPFPLPGGLEAEVFPVPGKLPLYLEDRAADHAWDAATAGLEIRRGDVRLVFVPGCAGLPPRLVERLAAADLLFFDGTLFTDDEMIRAGAGKKTGRRMGHMPVGGPDGSLAALAGLRNRRFYIHMNNTNPLLVEGSPERRAAEAAGWEIAADGLEVEL